MDNTLQEEVHSLHAQLCQGLADPKRILILYALDGAPHRVTDLAEALDIPQPTVSHHLKILRNRGLVTVEREGTAAYYSLTDRRVIKALDLLREMMADQMARRANLLGASL